MTGPDTEPLSPRAREIVAAARDLVEEEGRAALSMRRLADRLGIRAPSIYKHLPDKQALENALISSAFEDQADHFEAALADSDDPLGALAAAYRDYARRHPELYRLMTERPLDREHLTAGAEQRAARPIVQALGGDLDLARAAWAFDHGMTILELNERFPPGADLDAAWNAPWTLFARSARSGFRPDSRSRRKRSDNISAPHDEGFRAQAARWRRRLLAAASGRFRQSQPRHRKPNGYRGASLSRGAPLMPQRRHRLWRAGRSARSQAICASGL